MSSEEFSLHLAMQAVEPAGPMIDMQRWAALMAAVMNGPRKRKHGNKLFTAEDFLPKGCSWAEQPGQIQLVTKPGQKPPRMAPDFSHLRGMRVNNKRR
jgi:hypothetical protein